MNTPPNTSNIQGFYEFYKNGELVGSSKNTLNNGFLSRFLNAQTHYSFARCYCGTGTTAPTVTDVGMETFLAGSFSASRSYDNKANYVDNVDGNYKIMYTYVFAYDDAAFSGNISEVGIRFPTTSSSTGLETGTTIDSRTLVRDENGTTTAITITSSDTFTVVAKFITTLPLTGTGSVNVGGTGHTATWELLNFSQWHGMLHRLSMIEFDTATAFRISTTQPLINDPTYASLTPGTSQTTVTESGIVWATYFDYRFEMALTQADLVAGIEYFQFHNDAQTGSTARIRWGLHFSPKITDASAQTIHFTIRWNYTIN